MLVTFWRVAVALAAVAVVVIVVHSALRTIVVPRGRPDRLTRLVFRVLDACLAGQACVLCGPA
jgi:anti-sigma-K factor RskA